MWRLHENCGKINLGFVFISMNGNANISNIGNMSPDY